MDNTDLKQIAALLTEPFYADELEWKPQGRAYQRGDKNYAQAAPYVSNRAIQARLDAVVGIAGWKNEFQAGPIGGMMCGISLKLGDEWVTKWDGADESDIEKIKGAFSNAMKRAAVQWGIGRYLYEQPRTYVPCEVSNNGKSIKLLEVPVLPKAGYPKDADNKGNRPGFKAPSQPTQKAKSEPAKKQDKSEPASEKTTEEKAPTAKEEKAQPSPATPPNTQPDDAKKILEAYYSSLLIPGDIGVPMAGKSLAQVSKDVNLGQRAIIPFLAGKIKNKNDVFFNPGDNDGLLELQKGALFFYAKAHPEESN